MRLEFFVDTYRPYISGVTTAVDMTSSQLRARGHEVTVNAPTYPDHPNSPYEDHVRRIPSLPLPGYDGLRIATPLPFHLAPKERFDIVHAHSPFPMGLAGLSLARDRLVPMVYTCHSLYPDYSEYVPWASSTLRKVLEAHLQYFCNRCDSIVAPSTYVRDKLLEWGVTQPITVIPTGTRLKPFRAIDRAAARDWVLRRHGLSGNPFLLLFVGRLAQEKNIEHLFRELARARRLNARKPNRKLHLLVVGTGPHEETLQTVVGDYNLQQHVTFTGTVEHQRVRRYYRGADAFVFPSTVETQGIVLVEALAGGLPIIALAAPATREVVRNGVEGLVVAAERGALATALDKLRNSEDMWCRFSQAAMKRAESFSVTHMVDRLEDLYAGVKANYVPPKRLTDTILPGALGPRRQDAQR